MEYQCQNKDCGGYEMIHQISRVTIKVVGDAVVDAGSECPNCGQYMVNITKFEGFGNPKKAKGDRGRKFFDRGKSQRIH